MNCLSESKPHVRGCFQEHGLWGQGRTGGAWAGLSKRLLSIGTPRAGARHGQQVGKGRKAERGEARERD